MKTMRREITLENDKLAMSGYLEEGAFVLRSLRRAGQTYSWVSDAQFGCSVIRQAGGEPEITVFAGVDEKLNGNSRSLTFTGPLGCGLELAWTLALRDGFSAIELTASLTNRSDAMLQDIACIEPFCTTIREPGFDVYTYGDWNNSSTTGARMGRREDLGSLAQWDGWSVLHARAADEALMLAGDVAGFSATNPGSDSVWAVQGRRRRDATAINAGILLGASRTAQTVTIAPGGTFTTPSVYLVLAQGGRDEAVNELRRFLRACVLLPLPDTSPEASYNVWYTDDRAEQLYLEDLELASGMGFDTFTLDASWNEDASIMPGSNDWTAGLGSYRESAVKFPRGMKYLSDKVHEKGMTFGLWICPQNIDARREKRGEFPDSFYAMINGERLHCDVQPLSLSTQLCLGNPEVVEWLKREIARIVQEWRIDWIKWDPSATVSFACNCGDHGHLPTNGVEANVRGRHEVMRYLMERFPRLRGWECIFDMEVARTNPTACSCMTLPDYTNRFVTGPMVGPRVWGGVEYSFSTYESKLSMPDKPFFEVSYLDYFFRNIMCQGGFSMGNITGMVGQRLANAPPGFNDHFKRHIILFKGYRRMFREDIYMLGLLANQKKWRAIEYVRPDASEAVVFIFRDGGDRPCNRLCLKGLDRDTLYVVASQNEYHGKEKTLTGAALMDGSYEVTLPHPYLAGSEKRHLMSDYIKEGFQEQLMVGSDVLVIRSICLGGNGRL